MARERFFSFNLACKQIFSVNLARRLEKLLSPDIYVVLARKFYFIKYCKFLELHAIKRGSLKEYKCTFNKNTYEVLQYKER